MKKKLLLIIATLAMITTMTIWISGCGEKTQLDPDKPVTLSLWHVYGEQADSPMNRLVDEFNSTVGKEKGVVISTTLMTNASQIGEKLLDAKAEKPGALDMPDLFFCHNSNAVEIGTENLVDWEKDFTKDELDDFLPDFLADGMSDDTLTVLPVTKSTQLLFINGTEFERFSKATKVSYDDLATWDGFFDVAGKYYQWSGGKPFCALDFILRATDLNAISGGASGDDLYKNDWYNFSNVALKKSWMQFANALVRGHIVVSDLYSNTQVMTGEVASGMGSSASILYYNDVVIYPDNTTENMDLQVLPMPYAKGGEKVATQAGVGLCALKTTAAKEEAVSLFAHWLTEPARNLDFAAETGYMPVTYEALKVVGDYNYKNDAYARLFAAFEKVQDSYTLVREPAFAGFYGKVGNFYTYLRENQGNYAARFKSGVSAKKLTDETWNVFRKARG